MMSRSFPTTRLPISVILLLGLACLPLTVSAQTYSARYVQQVLDGRVTMPAEWSTPAVNVREHQTLEYGILGKGASPTSLGCPIRLNVDDTFQFDFSIIHGGGDPLEDLVLEAATDGELTLESVASTRGTVNVVSGDSALIEIDTLDDSVAVRLDLRAGPNGGTSAFRFRVLRGGIVDFNDSCDIIVLSVIAVEGTISIAAGSQLQIAKFVELQLVGDTVGLILHDRAEVAGEGFVAVAGNAGQITLGNRNGPDPKSPKFARVANLRVDTPFDTRLRDTGDFGDNVPSVLQIGNRLEVAGRGLDVGNNTIALVAAPTGTAGMLVGEDAVVNGDGGRLVIDVLDAASGGFPNTREGAFPITGSGQIDLAIDKLSDAGVVFDLDEVGAASDADSVSFNRGGTLFITRATVLNGSFRNEGAARTEFRHLERIYGDLIVDGPGGEVTPNDTHSDPEGGFCDPDISQGNDSGVYFHSPVKIDGSTTLEETDDGNTADCTEGLVFASTGNVNEIEGDLSSSLGKSGISGPALTGKTADQATLILNGDLSLPTSNSQLILGEGVTLELPADSSRLDLDREVFVLGSGRIAVTSGEIQFLALQTEATLSNLELLNGTTLNVLDGSDLSTGQPLSLVIDNRLIVEEGMLNMGIHNLSVASERRQDARVDIFPTGEILGSGTLFITTTSAEEGGFPNTMADAFRIAGGGSLNMDFQKLTGGGVVMDVELGGAGTSRNRGGTLFLLNRSEIAGTFRHQSVDGARTEFHGPTSVAGDLLISGPGKQVVPDPSHSDPDGNVCDPDPANGNDSGVYLFQPLRVSGDVILADTEDWDTVGCSEGLTLLADSLHPSEDGNPEVFSVIEKGMTVNVGFRRSGLTLGYDEDAGAFHNLQINGNIESTGIDTVQMDKPARFTDIDPREISCEVPSTTTVGNKLRLAGDGAKTMHVPAVTVIPSLEIVGDEQHGVTLTQGSGTVTVSETLELIGSTFLTSGRFSPGGTATIVLHEYRGSTSSITRGDGDFVYYYQEPELGPRRVTYLGVGDRETGEEIASEIPEVEVALCEAGQSIKPSDEILVTDKIVLTSGTLDIQGTGFTLANQATVAVGEGSFFGSDAPQPDGDLHFLKREEGDFEPGVDGIDLLYFGSTDRTVGLEWPPAETDVEGRGTNPDLIRNVTINPLLKNLAGKGADVFTISLREEDRVFRINGTLLLADNALLDPAGTVLEGGQIGSVQFIHNTGDALSVDVAVNENLLLEDFDFRTGTAYLPVPAGDVNVDVFDANDGTLLSSNTWDILGGRTYLGVFEGLASSSERPLRLRLAPGSRVSSNPSLVELNVSNGSPDAGPIDVRTLDPGNSNLPLDILAQNLSYGADAGFTTLQPNFYTIDVVSSQDGSVFDAYRFDLTEQAGSTVTMLASGSPFTDGPLGFTLLAIDAKGERIVPSIVTSREDDSELPSAFALLGNYPNPFSHQTTVTFDLPRPADVQLEIIDVLGRSLGVFHTRSIPAGRHKHLMIDASGLGPGTYFYRLSTQDTDGTAVQSGKMIVVR